MEDGLVIIVLVLIILGYVVQLDDPQFRKIFALTVKFVVMYLIRFLFCLLMRCEQKTFSSGF